METAKSNHTPPGPDPLAVIIGSGVNAYGLVRSLRWAGVRRIAVVDLKAGDAGYSRYAQYIRLSDEAPTTFRDTLLSIGRTIGSGLLYPTSDWHLQMVARYELELSKYFCTNIDARIIEQYSSKWAQYLLARRTGVEAPQTVKIGHLDYMWDGNDPIFPVIIKRERFQKGVRVPKNQTVRNTQELNLALQAFKPTFESGMGIIASEIIPGSVDQFFVFNAFRGKTREITGWTGRKLSEFPHPFGVSGTVEHYPNDEVVQLATVMIEEMDGIGTFSFEFKWDSRDKAYKFIEVNFRPQADNLLGSLIGTNLAYCQYLDALGLRMGELEGRKNKRSRVVHGGHEVQRLFSSRGFYSPTFLRNTLLRGGSRCWSVCNLRDPIPGLVGILRLWKTFYKKILANISITAIPKWLKKFANLASPVE